MRTSGSVTANLGFGNCEPTVRVSEDNPSRGGVSRSAEFRWGVAVFRRRSARLTYALPVRNPFGSGDRPVIDPRWNEYLETGEFGGRAASTRTSESPHERELRDLMGSIVEPWQRYEATSRETLIRLRRLADLQL